MKKQIIDFVDPDLIDLEEDGDQVINLTGDQSIDLYLTNTVTIKGRIFFKKAQPDSVLKVIGKIKDDKLIACSGGGIFVLSPRQKECLSCNKAIMVTDLEVQNEKIKEKSYQKILAR